MKNPASRSFRQGASSMALASVLAMWNLNQASGQCELWHPVDGGVAEAVIGTQPGVLSLTTYQGELIVGGTFVKAGGLTVNSIARWNGSQWSSLGSGLGGSFPRVDALAVYHNEVVAGGTFISAGGQSANNIARWNGTSWQNLGTGANDLVMALAVYNDELVAGGMFTTAGAVNVNRIARWNGSTWSAVGQGVLTANPPLVPLVESLTVYNGELIVGGLFFHVGGVGILANNIGRWNGASWLPVSSASGTGVSGLFPNNVVRALTVYRGELIVGGHFTFSGGQQTRYIARWDGVTWQPLGTGMDNDVLDLAVYNNQLIACGFFTSAGQVPATHIAAWNGKSWSPIDSGLSDTGACLGQYRHELFTGGSFALADDETVNRIARWQECKLPCSADVSPPNAHNGVVDIDDLVMVITNWNSMGPNVADATNDGIVDIDDLVQIITHWGACV